jgi:hypothetical protein
MTDTRPDDDFITGQNDGYRDQQNGHLQDLSAAEQSDQYGAGYIYGRALAAAPHPHDAMAVNTWAAQFSKETPTLIPVVRSALKKKGILIPMRFDFIIQP